MRCCCTCHQGGMGGVVSGRFSRMRRVCSQRTQLARPRGCGVGVQLHRAVGRRLLNLGFELFHEPEAGMYLWARHPDLPDSAELSKEATAAGIMLGPGQLFLVEPRPTGWLRFNVSFSQDERLWRFLEQRILLGQQAAG